MRKVPRRPLTVAEKVEARVARRKGDVFLRADFADLGSYDRIGLVLGQLVRKGSLLRVGQGVYTRAAPSIIDGKPVPVKGIGSLMSEALDRLGIKTRPTRLERAYNSGQTTQVPTGRLIGVNRRVRRKLGYNGMTVSFERV
ncbi:type IV toxin-antitoxin system AbiEi family antitoxin domain-containing protein [Vineibacter terrae]|uniref:Type IV toxin-antitoxin system AbiEi family antitoxin domain-containing protein n=1 Tax=Vineibacter terrae TaxID=2586908 RepID=A0A5C8P7F1_9HYPH|nr:type IV toxin-antitoxin system AbiEi family antitoxin domain-containing protein [Vineibacter terrae]